MRSLRPSWIEVDAGAIRENVRVLKNRVGERVALFATLKSNACGFDLEQAGPLLAKMHEVHGIAVVDGGDAIALRRSGISKPILVFGGMLLDAQTVALAADFDLIVTAHDPNSLAAILSSDRPVDFVVEFNVGAERLGFSPEDAERVISQLRSARAKLAGVTAHMGVPAGERRGEVVRRQYARFLPALERFREAGVELRYSLIASSQTLLEADDMNLTAVDPGHLIFGFVPRSSGELGRRLRCALSAIKSRIVQVNERSAVFPFGASDGLMRIECGNVLIRGRKASLLAINAEHAIADISAIPESAVGDEVVIVGEQGDEAITVADVEARYPRMRSRADVTRNVSPLITRIYS